MVQAVEKAGVPNMVWYNYRARPPSRWPSNSLMKDARAHFPLSREVPADWTISKDLPQGGAACGGWT